jgi:mRNA-degrading endonuclease RelE of RelBE toxin-antitoxin system
LASQQDLAESINEMEFRISDTFITSLSRLTAQEQKAVKTTAFDLQIDPKSPGKSIHRLDRVKDDNFWSLRVNADIRIIIHRLGSSILLAYVDHHDQAYAWAARRKIEHHPKAGPMRYVLLEEQRDHETLVVMSKRIANPKTSASDMPAGSGVNSSSSVKARSILGRIRNWLGMR